jgi:hypothetical protein
LLSCVNTNHLNVFLIFVDDVEVLNNVNAFHADK